MFRRGGADCSRERGWDVNRMKRNTGHVGSVFVRTRCEQRGEGSQSKGRHLDVHNLLLACLWPGTEMAHGLL